MVAAHLSGWVLPTKWQLTQLVDNASRMEGYVVVGGEKISGTLFFNGGNKKIIFDFPGVQFEPSEINEIGLFLPNNGSCNYSSYTRPSYPDWVYMSSNATKDFFRSSDYYYTRYYYYTPYCLFNNYNYNYEWSYWIVNSEHNQAAKSSIRPVKETSPY